jgi:hypothetical protein
VTAVPRIFAAAIAGVVGLVVSVVLLLGGAQQQQAAASCGPASAPGVSVAGVPGGPVAGYAGDQLANAAIVIRAGGDKGFDAHGQTIGVMVAMDEARLHNVDHGDTVGPDSTGLFQQRDPWGPRSARMDPYTAATMFFTGGQGGQHGLDDIPGWEFMTPTAAAHAVQRNADPNVYAKFWAPATQVVAALSGADVTVLASSDGSTGVSCDAPPPTAVSAGPGGWVNPVPTAKLVSGFGIRWGAPHNGIDLAAPLGTPIYAAAAGTVVGVCTTNSPPCTGFGSLITIDHGGGVVTRYGHMYPPDVLVHVGDHVTAGQQIARVGSNGQSTGPHCHVETVLNGRPVDPVPVFTSHGVPLH